MPVTGPPSEAPPAGGGDEEASEVLGVNEAPELPEVPAARPVVEAVPVRAQAAAPAAEQLGELPFTGHEPLLLGLLGLLSLATGLALTRLLGIRSHP